MLNKHYGCENACQDILNYYHRKLGDDKLEFEGILLALEHIFVDDNGKKKTNCERCYKYMQQIRNKEIKIAL